MMMPVRHEVIPFIGAALVAGLAVTVICRLFGMRWSLAWRIPALFAAVLSVYFLFFFRNPARTAPGDSDAIIAGADGVIARIAQIEPDRFIQLAQKAGLDPTGLGRLTGGPCTRISIFLSLFDVHVNRAPISGASTFLGYFPGRHFFTFQEKSSDHNQHNSILIQNEQTCCLFNQIVGPVCRRVVYWPDKDRAVRIKAGDPIGMMKFGSRLDMYFPSEDILVTAKEGDKVRAGESIIARLRKDPGQS